MNDETGLPTSAPEPKLPEHESMVEGEEAQPRGVRLMALVRWLILAVAAAVAGLSWWSYARAQGDAASSHSAPKYQCPMHPQIVASEPGECPICHMALEPIAPQRAAGAQSAAPPPPVAPIGAPPVAPIGATPVGTTDLLLSLDRVQSIGVRTSLVREDDVARAMRVTATVVAPEQGVAEVHVRTPGFVEKLLVAQTGVPVAKGQPLFSFYSPELLQAQQELAITRRWATGDAGDVTARAARTKLSLLGMSDREIDHLVETGEPVRAVVVHAPQSGFVTKKGLVHGSYITPEMVLYEIQDLSRVYVVASVFQRDLGSIGPGTEGVFRAARRPSEAIRAKVDLVYPAVAAEARTTRVRMQVQNVGMALRPGEYGTVELATPARKALVIPRDALVDTGTQTYVFVAESEGRFTPRIVAVSGETRDGILLEGGVRVGERVVSGATFLIDSESRLQAGRGP